MSILGSKTLEVIHSDASVINADGADEGSKFSKRLRSVALMTEAYSSSSFR